MSLYSRMIADVLTFLQLCDLERRLKSIKMLSLVMSSIIQSLKETGSYPSIHMSMSNVFSIKAPKQSSLHGILTVSNKFSISFKKATEVATY